MNLKRPNKKLEQQIRQAVQGMLCPIHRKPASVTMESENEPVHAEACCVHFHRDVMQTAERIRKDYLYRDEKTRERLERERRRDNRGEG